MQTKKWLVFAAMTLLISLAALAPVASAGNTFEVDCGSGTSGAWAEAQASSSSSDGTESYAHAKATFVAAGLQEETTGPISGSSYSYAYADARSDIDKDVAHVASSEAEAHAGDENGDKTCSSKILLDFIPVFNNLPGWVQDEILLLECTWGTGSSSYAYSGEIHYNTANDAIYLQQISNVVNLTAAPGLAAGGPTLPIMPLGSTATTLTLDAFGDRTTGCRLLMDEG